jgi:hypothetical protein
LLQGLLRVEQNAAQAFVFAAVADVVKLFAAVTARKGLVGGVCSSMPLQITHVGRRVGALRTVELSCQGFGIRGCQLTLPWVAAASAVAVSWWWWW